MPNNNMPNNNMPNNNMPNTSSEISNNTWLYLVVKRAIDLLLGVPLLIVAAPIFLTAAVFIRLESKGNPFFIQERIGLRGKPFKMIKLRGMYVDAKTRFPDMYEYNNKKDLNFHFHMEHDPRVTKVGSFTRRSSIDELPNFINVVIGNMSLVGPRPEIPEVISLYGSLAEQYVSVKPGITCISKCTGRDSLTKMETIKLDLGYIRNRSLTLDMQTLWKTFLNVVLRKDVH
jgi:lipopolysaccharide/colanic/teichoic acid biosynthesis glycosyltransferase